MRPENASAGPLITGSPLPRSAIMAGACVVIAEFEVKAEALEDFIALARRFAAECVHNEPGCRQFDVVHIEPTPTSVLFYEAYDDAAAFRAHCSSAHLARFKAAFPPMIIGERPLRRGLT